MENVNIRLEKMGLRTSDLMMPKKGVDLSKWAVVACDQYTSEKEYWKDVYRIDGNDQSNLRLIFPECYLDDG
ncbi:MAG: DUF1015 domain-containing protein, partial [Spirochaetales bacterium]|nr:DUF1015 domain-containing protein [Spirochaetales bacterium]